MLSIMSGFYFIAVNIAWPWHHKKTAGQGRSRTLRRKTFALPLAMLVLLLYVLTIILSLSCKKL